MSRSVNALRGGLSGAATGASIGSFLGPAGTVVVGVGGGLYGLASGAFSKTDEEISSGRIRDLITKYNQMKAQEEAALSIQTGKNVGLVNKFATGQKAQSNAGIARRSASQGLTGDNEASILSSENQIGTQASKSIEDIIAQGDRAKLGIDQRYNSLIAGAEYDNASQPIDPSGVDVLETLAGPAMQFAQNRDFINAIKGNSGATPGTPGAIAPSTPGSLGSMGSIGATTGSGENVLSLGDTPNIQSDISQPTQNIASPTQSVASAINPNYSRGYSGADNSSLGIIGGDKPFSINSKVEPLTSESIYSLKSYKGSDNMGETNSIIPKPKNKFHRMWN